MDRHQHERFADNLKRVQGAVRRRLLVHGLVTWLAVAGLVVLAQLLVLGWLEPPRWVRLPLVVCGWLVVALAAYEALWRPWRALRTRTDLVRRLDRAGAYADTLAAAEEALRQPDRWRADTPIRQALLARLLARAARLLDDLSLPRLLPVWRPATVYALMILVLLGGVWYERAAPESLWRGWRALLAPWPATDFVAAGSLRLVPGPAHVPAGGEVTVAVLDLAGGAGPLVGEVRAGSGYWQRQPARQVPVPGADAVRGAPYERWEITLSGVTEDLNYRFRRGDRISPAGALTVVHPPLLLSLAARIQPPAYTGLPDQDLPRLPAYIEAPQGSRLALVGQASTVLTAAALVTAAGDTLALTARADSLLGTITLEAPLRFWPTLRDERGLAGRGELIYEIGVVPDRPPVARLLRPQDDGSLPLSAPLELRAIAEDDYGLTGMDLLVRRGDAHGGIGAGAPLADERPGRSPPTLEEQGWERLPLLFASALPALGRQERTTSLGALPLTVTARPAVTAGIHLDLSLQAGNLRLIPGDVLELMLEARDNREPGPPAVGRSAVLRLTIPSSLALLRAREEAQTRHRDDLAGMRNRSEALSAELERLRRELLRNPIPGWDRRQLLQDAVERQQEVQSELASLVEAMSQDLESLVENRLSSPQLMDQMDRIAELLAATRNDAMRELLDRMRESLAEMSPRELAAAMEDLTRDQQDMLRRLDTALDMLRDLAREQQLAGLTELVADLLRKQQELAEGQRPATPPGEPTADDDPATASADQQTPAEGEPGDAEGEGTAADGEPGDAESDLAAAAGEMNGEQGTSAAEATAEDQAGEATAQPSAEDLARQQEALAAALAELEERLQEALAELEAGADADPSAAAEAMREALAEALQQLQEQQTGETMQQAGQDLLQDDSESALANMEQALAELAGLYHVLLRSQMAMQMAMQMEQSDQMRNLAADLLELSERQESLALDLPTSLRDVRSDDLVRRQNIVLRGAIALRDGLHGVAAAAPREVMQMLEQLDKLIERLGRVLNQLQDGRAHASRHAAETALGEMNQLVIHLLTQAQMTGQGSGSGSSQAMLTQQLQQMAQEQAGLNALAEQLSRQQGRLSQELRAGMQRLQQGQEGLSGRASDLAEQQHLQEQQEGGRLLGDLDQLARDMQSVGDDIAGGLITDDILRRQDRILGRLLDMHNASRERDWSRRRESRTADETFAEQDGMTGREIEVLPPEAQRWRAVQQAPPAYRELVRDYFREIQRLHEQTGRDPDGQRMRAQELP
jgi:hypothetical protein